MWVLKFFQGSSFLSFHSLMAFEANPSELGGGSGGTSTEGGSEGQGSSHEYSDFAQGILKDVPEEHREILQPYLTKWDAGTTRRFQDLHNQYKPYADLGWDSETTQQMAEVYRVLNEEPEKMYQALREALAIEDGKEQTPPSEAGSQTDQVIQGLPPEITEQLTQQQQVLEALAQYVLGEQTQRTETQQDSEFESYMGLLKTELGDFDEQYVTMAIANGIDGEAAVKQWQSMAQEIINKASQATANLPPAMLSSAGGGAVAQAEPQRLGSYDSRDIKNLIANVITQANQAGQ
jgi:hypothetical protein